MARQKRIEKFISPYRITDGSKFRLSRIDPADVAGIDDKRRAQELLERGIIDLAEMQATQVYFRAEGHDPTDVEIETIAQTWSEHCVHKTFKAKINFTTSPSPLGGEAKGEERAEDGGEINRLISNAIGRVYFSTSVFYTVIENDKPRWVQVRTDSGTALVWLAGQLRKGGDFAQLQPGLYPMLVTVAIGDTRPWGRIMMKPRLAEVSESERKASIEAENREHQELLKDWRADVDWWKQSGEVDPRLTRIFVQGRSMMYHYLQQSLASGGFPNAMSFDGTTDALVARYLAGYRTMCGQDLCFMLARYVS